MRLLATLTVTFALAATACGSSTKDEVATTEAPTTETPTTEAPATTAAPASTSSTVYEKAVVTSSPDEESIVENWDLAFGIGSFADRSHTIVGSQELESTVESYVKAVEGFGSIVLPVTAIAIEGETATITYDVLGNGAVMAPDLTGEMVLADGTWQVTRESFCEAMSLARNSCPVG